MANITTHSTNSTPSAWQITGIAVSVFLGFALTMVLLVAGPPPVRLSFASIEPFAAGAAMMGIVSFLMAILMAIEGRWRAVILAIIGGLALGYFGFVGALDYSLYALGEERFVEGLAASKGCLEKDLIHYLESRALPVEPLRAACAN